MIKWILIILLVMPGLVQAYYPGYCNSGTAKADVEESDIIIVGRVIGNEQVVDKIQGKSRNYELVGYYARIKLGEVLKGNYTAGLASIFIACIRTAAGKGDLRVCFLGQRKIRGGGFQGRGGFSQ